LTTRPKKPIETLSTGWTRDRMMKTRAFKKKKTIKKVGGSQGKKTEGNPGAAVRKDHLPPEFKRWGKKSRGKGWESVTDAFTKVKFPPKDTIKGNPIGEGGIDKRQFLEETSQRLWGKEVEKCH